MQVRLYGLALLGTFVVLAHGAPAMGVIVGTRAVNPANDHVYVLLAPSTWNEAHAQAASLGGYLVTIDDQAEQDWVRSQFGFVEVPLILPESNVLSHPSATRKSWVSLWIGLAMPAAGPEDAAFEWGDGSSTVYSNWAPFSPSHYRGERRYAAMNTFRNGRWYNTIDNPNGRFYGVVEITPVPVPEPAAGALALIGIGLAVRGRKRRTGICKGHTSPG